MTELTKEDFLLLAEAATDYPPGYAYGWGIDGVPEDGEVSYYLQHPEHG
jgi:hypothetical protein